MTLNKLTKNILKRFDQATVHEYILGKRWYLSAWQRADDIAREGDEYLPTVAAVIAALSPGVSWERNLMAARQLVVDGRLRQYTGYKSNARKARQVLRGKALANVFKPGAMKVLSFAELIESGGKSDAVCIDSHARNVADGVVQGSHKALSLTLKQYIQYAEAYRAAAALVMLRPCQVQAVTWLVQKRLVQAALAKRRKAGR